MTIPELTLVIVSIGALGAVGNFILQATWYHKSKHTWKEPNENSSNK